MIRLKTIGALAATMICLSATAQDTGRTASASLYLTPFAKADVNMPFSVVAEGRRFQPVWGLDMAWEDANNVRKGINHMGVRNVGIGRTSFRTQAAMKDETTLATDHITHLRNRSSAFDLVSDTLPLIMNSDCGAGTATYYSTNGRANIDHWCQMLDAHVAWMQQNTRHPILGVSPFNEPDFSVEQGQKTDFRDIAKKLKAEYPRFDTLVITGGNTLNCDEALPWYTPMKDYMDWGNTHQLAGSFDSYANFYQQLAADGKVGMNDEMHNVAETMVGLEYGMTVGIWWGFVTRARGELCDISNHGTRLAYSEHRPNWCAASVWRHDETGQVKAFLGQSERQGCTTSFLLASTDREVYFDGQGPMRHMLMEIPGGKPGEYATKNHPNAERVIDVCWGADVPPFPIDGTYKVMNKATLSVIAEYGTDGGNTNISQMKYSGQKTQQWRVSPVDTRIGGDYSFYDLQSVNDSKHLDVMNYSLQSGANVIAYGNASPFSNQQWYLEYAGDGYYYIRNRESALYLSVVSSSKNNGTNIVQQTLQSGEAARDRQLWRFLPLEAECELEAPATPAGLTATPGTASVRLQWEPNAEEDLDGYMLLRAEQGTDDWNTIARRLTGTAYIDNTCRQGRQYEYRLKAIDRSCNQSQPCEPVSCAPTAAPALIAHWDFEQDALDQTENQFDMAAYGSPTYNSMQHQSGGYSLYLDGSNKFMQLPYEVASTDELTVAMWVNWRSSSAEQQRLFDFGNGEQQGFYLTPAEGQRMRFVITNGEEQQTVEAPKLSTMRWRHVAVTIGSDRTVIYVDGEEAGSSAGSTLRPSDIGPTLNYIGRGQAQTIPMLKAYLDDVRIYNYALTADEVMQLAASEADGISRPSQPADPAQPTVYGIDGQQRRQAAKGINLIRHADGTVQKVIR